MFRIEENREYDKLMREYWERNKIVISMFAFCLIAFIGNIIGLIVDYFPLILAGFTLNIGTLIPLQFLLYKQRKIIKKLEGYDKN